MNNFVELTNAEIMDTNGGIVLTTGAIIAISCFAGGTVLGIGWALCD